MGNAGQCMRAHAGTPARTSPSVIWGAGGAAGRAGAHRQEVDGHRPLLRHRWEERRLLQPLQAQALQVLVQVTSTQVHRARQGVAAVGEVRVLEVVLQIGKRRFACMLISCQRPYGPASCPGPRWQDQSRRTKQPAGNAVACPQPKRTTQRGPSVQRLPRTAGGLTVSRAM